MPEKGRIQRKRYMKSLQKVIDMLEAINSTCVKEIKKDIVTALHKVRERVMEECISIFEKPQYEVSFKGALM